MRRLNVLDKIRKECDVIIKVADARSPKTLFPLRTRKRVIIVLNKIDLVDDAEAARLRERYADAILTSTRTRKGKGHLLHTLIRIAKEEGRLIRVGVVGYPNVGKSSVINMIRGKRSAKVSATPGETRGLQWLKIKDNILVYDTPGVIMHRRDEEDLVRTFAVPAERAENPEEIAEGIIKSIIKKHGVGHIEGHYGIVCGDATPHGIVGLVAERQGMLLKGGGLDLDRAAKKIIMDFQKGRIG